MAKKERLDFARIVQPCSVAWEYMTGDERTRFCKECNKQVYNFAALTSIEIDRLINATHGQLCARITKTADGKTLTADSVCESLPVLDQLIHRRPSLIASAIVSAVLSLSPTIAAQAQPAADPLAVVLSTEAESNPKANPQGGTASVAGRVQGYQIDTANRRIIAKQIGGAQVRLINESTNEVWRVITNEQGEFCIENLPAGVFIFKVEAAGFDSHTRHAISVQAGKQKQMDVTLRSAAIDTLSGVFVYRATPLHELYVKSDRVVIATVERITLRKGSKDEDSATVKLAITRTLKSAEKSEVYFYESYDQSREINFAEGDRVLAFLQRRESRDGLLDGYEPLGWDEGIKKLTAAELKLYTERLEELSDMLDAEKPEDERLAEWLVRCVEEEATRDEGASELADGARTLRYHREAQAKEAERSEVAEDDNSTEEQTASETGETQAASEGEPEGETTELLLSAGELESASDEESLSDVARAVARLTAEQKERALIFLFNAQKAEDIHYGLVEFALQLKDARLVPFLLSHLKQLQNSEDESVWRLVRCLGNALDDDEVTELQREFIEGEDLLYRRIIETEIQHDEQADALKAKKRRSEILERFIALVESKIKK